MAETQEAAESKGSRDETTAQIVEGVSKLVNAWTEASAEMWVGTSRVLTNLATELAGTSLAGTSLEKSVNRAMRDSADVMRRCSDVVAKAYPSDTDDSE